MPIIKSKEKSEKEQIKINIGKPIAEKVRQYCDWLGMKKTDEFFEQAAEFVLSKDKDWLNHLSSHKTAI